MSGWKTNDTEPPLEGTAMASATPVSLTGASDVSVHISRPDGTVISRSVVLGNQTTSPGSWSLAWQTGDLSLAGGYSVELQVTWSAGRIQTFPGDNSSATFRVAQEIA